MKPKSEGAKMKRPGQLLIPGMTFNGLFEYDHNTKSYHIIGGVTKADGQLIAAAPELLEAAERFEKFATETPSTKLFNLTDIQGIVNDIVNAIRKAEGGK